MMDSFYSKLLFSLLFIGLTLAGGAVYFQAARGMGGAEKPTGPAAGSFKQRFIALGRETEDRLAHTTPAGEAYYQLQLMMGKREFNNFALVKSLDGEFNYGSFYRPETARLRETAKFYQKLQDSVDVSGGRMIYYSPPVRPVRGASTYDQGMPHLNLNPLVDEFLNYLREYGVDFIDARYSLTRRPELPPERVLYKTDPLWTSQAAFEAFVDLVNNLKGDRGLDLDPAGFYTDRRNYNFKTYPQLFLGGFGHRSSPLVTGLEDFTAIWPNFDNNYAVEIFDQQFGFMRQAGGADQTLYYERLLSPPALDSPGSGDSEAYRPYNYYLLGLHSMVTIKNTDHPERPRVLLIHDSFGVQVGCLMAPLCGELIMIDPLAGDYVPDLSKYIGDQECDLLVVLLSMNAI